VIWLAINSFFIVFMFLILHFRVVFKFNYFIIMTGSIVTDKLPSVCNLNFHLIFSIHLLALYNNCNDLCIDCTTLRLM